MIYILRLLYAWLLPPGLFLLLFLAACYLFLKTQKKRWLILFFILTYLLSISAVSNQLIKPLENHYPQPTINDLKDAQAIVVLGGGVCDTVPDFDGEGQLSENAANRFIMGLRLYKALHIPIILSGGQGFSRTITEAEIAQRTLAASGIEEKYLLKEDKSRNTYENALYTKQLCQEKHFQKIILVTSAYHLPRSVILFQREGINVIPYPAGYLTSKNTILNAFSFTPSHSSLRNTAISMKEYLGIFSIMTKLQ